MVLSVIFSILFFLTTALFLIKFISQLGITLPNNKIFSYICTDKSPVTQKSEISNKEYLKIFIFAFLFRVAIFIVAYLAKGIFSESQLSFMDYCNSWNLWDAPHYIEIAQQGYANHIEDGQYLMLVFFPLYPILIKFFTLIIQNYIISALLVSFLAYSFGCVLMYNLVAIDYNKSIAKKSIIFLSVSPFAFFFGGIVTESTFFLIIIATFLAIRKHNYLIAGILGIFASLTRSGGVLMIIPAAIEWIQDVKPLSLIKEKQTKELSKNILKVIPILLIPIGTLIYLLVNYNVTGDPFAFLTYQKEHWSQGLQFFGKTIKLMSGYAFGDDLSLAVSIFIPGLVSVFIAIIAAAYGIRRTRLMYIAFLLFYIMYNSGATWPLSICRYIMCSFPAYWILAEFTERHKETEIPIIVLMTVCFGIYLVGYITVHQIM